MALARSASVPGGLSINTGAANLFGAPAASQAPASGGLFGAATTAAKPATGLFGAAATTTAAPAAATPSLFGAPAASTATTAAPATGGLFGGATAAAKPALGGGLFGTSTTTATTTAPAAGGGLFGGGATTTTAPATGGGLFGGGATATTTAAPATGGGLFGSTAASTAAAPAAGGGLFGASTAAKPATTGGLFGASTAAAPAASTMSGGLFGASTAAQQQQQQQQVVPGVRIDLSNLKGTTRFNDLQESLQKDIIAFDSLIQSYIEQKNQVEAFLPAHSESLEAIPGDVRFVARKYDGVSGAMAADLQAIQSLRETVKQDAEHAQLSFKALDNQKLPAQFHTSGLWSTGAGGPKTNGRGRDGAGDDRSDGKAGDRTGGDGGGRTDLINYFSHTGDEIGQQLRKLESNLGEIEVHMYSVQAGLLEQLQRIAASSSSGAGASASPAAGLNGDGSGSSDDKVAELAAVLRDFEESILTVASVVGSARESMTGLQLGDFLGQGR